jgi:hypothetical protein
MAVLPEPARAKPLEIWFQDEARIGQKGTLTRLWAKRGTRPRAPRVIAAPSGPICLARSARSGGPGRRS